MRCTVRFQTGFGSGFSSIEVFTFLVTSDSSINHTIIVKESAADISCFSSKESTNYKAICENMFLEM